MRADRQGESHAQPIINLGLRHPIDMCIEQYQHTRHHPSPTQGPLPSAFMSSIRKNPHPFISPVRPGLWHCQKNAISSSITSTCCLSTLSIPVSSDPSAAPLGRDRAFTGEGARRERALAFWSARSSLGNGQGMMSMDDLGDSRRKAAFACRCSLSGAKGTCAGLGMEI